MVQTSRKIQQSIEQLQQQTMRLGDELQSLYEGYFEVLSEACQRQLVLAAYHVCTQVYPDAFLRLSYSKREKLQKTLQQLGYQVREQLQERWQQAQQVSQKSQQDDGLALIRQLFLQAEATRTDGESTPGDATSHGKAPSEDPTVTDTSLSSDDEADEEDSDVATFENFENDFSDWLAVSEAASEATEDSEGGAASDAESDDEAAVKDSAGSGEDAARPRYRLLKVEETGAGTNISFIDEEDPNRASLRDRLIARLSAHKASSSTAPPTGETAETRPSDSDSGDADSGDADSSEDTARVEDPSEANGPVSSEAQKADAAPVLTEPTQLLRLQLFTEKALRDVLKTISETANYLLQQDQIVPDMPKALLAAAAESDGLSQTPLKTPNLLKISVRVLHDRDDADDDDDRDEDDEEAVFDDDLARRLEQMLRARALRERSTRGEQDAEGEADSTAGTDDDLGDDSDGGADGDKSDTSVLGRLPRVVQIESLPEFIVIHLRLSEVEFADPRVAAQRRRIRSKMNDLKKLGRVYKKAQRQLAIAQAEDAWRASWIE